MKIMNLLGLASIADQCILGTKADDWSNCKFPIQCFIYSPDCEPHIYMEDRDQHGNEDDGGLR